MHAFGINVDNNISEKMPRNKTVKVTNQSLKNNHNNEKEKKL